MTNCTEAVVDEEMKEGRKEIGCKDCKMLVEKIKSVVFPMSAGLGRDSYSLA